MEKWCSFNSDDKGAPFRLNDLMSRTRFEEILFNNAKGNEQVRTFCYTEVFHKNHYQYRHVVDDNNNNRLQPFSIEETWKTALLAKLRIRFHPGGHFRQHAASIRAFCGKCQAGQLGVQERPCGGDDTQPRGSCRGRQSAVNLRQFMLCCVISTS